MMSSMSHLKTLDHMKAGLDQSTSSLKPDPSKASSIRDPAYFPAGSLRRSSQASQDAFLEDQDEETILHLHGGKPEL
jgi:hypothetical protein